MWRGPYGDLVSALEAEYPVSAGSLSTLEHPWKSGTEAGVWWDEGAEKYKIHAGVLPGTTKCGPMLEAAFRTMILKGLPKSVRDKVTDMVGHETCYIQQLKEGVIHHLRKHIEKNREEEEERVEDEKHLRKMQIAELKKQGEDRKKNEERR